MTRANIVIGTTIAILTIGILAFLNRPEVEPTWPARIQGFCFSPMHLDQNPSKGIYPTTKEIDADLSLLEGKAYAVRTYSMASTLGDVASLAERHHLNVTLGAWISRDLARNEREIKRVIEVANKQRNVVRVIVGNEALLRGEVSAAQLAAYLDRVRSKVVQPVSTAETWSTWLLHPELAKHTDFVAVHILPYWEKVDVGKGVQFVVDKYNLLKSVFPKHPIVIAEVGWPSHGRTQRNAVASSANEAIFLRRFLARAEKEKYVYYLMEAFDQPWKRSTEGDVGAYWGIWDAQRVPKFSFAKPIVANPNWKQIGALSVLLAVLTFTILTVPSRTLKRRGRSFLAVVAFASATGSVWIIYDFLDQYLTARSVAVGLLLILGMVGIIMVVLTEAHEWAEASWVTERRRGLPFVAGSDLPMVSIHVPAYNAPPEMLIANLDALAGLDYPNYEVLVIDNNTSDPAVWEPVRAHCEALGPRFRFFHVAPLSGFKAGALNFALKQTTPEAEVVAVIDSDYVVDARWLRDLAPQFQNPQIAIVQAPQDYRDGNDSAFKATCYSEYAGFFHIGMITRNERNAIIQHGTMTMVRRSVLEQVGGWGEWCITEDAELGLRIFQAGYEALYVPRSYGRGLMPDTFLDYKKQRFRWAYGAVQILRRHAWSLFTSKSTLTRGQRYHFLAGWLPWLADGFNLLFNVAALAWTLGMLVLPGKVDPPMMAFSALPLVLFAFKSAKFFYIYKARVGASTAQTIAGALGGLALAHTISRAILLGFVTKGIPFFRTPKMAARQGWRHALVVAREEGLLMLALWLAAGAMVITQNAGSPDERLWMVVLLMQSLPYLAAVTVSFIASFSRLPARIGIQPLKRPEHGYERRTRGRPQPSIPHRPKSNLSYGITERLP